jgi:ABC-type nitrate/sulfonate/bicarbonate transport system substrate-binding protein
LRRSEVSSDLRLVQNIFLPNAAMIAAEALGAFAACGVEIETTFTRSSLDQRAALVDGSADVAVTALDNLFDWNRSDDARFRAVAQIERTTSLPLYLAASIGSLADLAQLQRPRLVVDSPSSGFGIALVAAVEGLGISRERIEIIAAGGVNERLTALAVGDGDVALLAPFVAAAATEAGLRRAGALEDLYPAYPGLVVVMLEDRGPNVARAVRAYLAALTDGRDWLNRDPQAGVAALMATGLPEPAARAQLALCGCGPLTVSRDGFALLREIRHGQGLLPALNSDYDDFVTDQFLKED